MKHSRITVKLEHYSSKDKNLYIRRTDLNKGVCKLSQIFYILILIERGSMYIFKCHDIPQDDTFYVTIFSYSLMIVLDTNVWAKMVNF